MEGQQYLALVTEISCNSISKRQDEYLNVTIYYYWQGSSRVITGYAVVTQEAWFSGFDEIGSTKINFSVTMPESPNSPTSGYFTAYFLPLSGCSAKSGYGIKVKVNDFAEWGCKNVLTVTSGTGQALSISSLYIY
jgi:hypothetical protein